MAVLIDLLIREPTLLTKSFTVTVTFTLLLTTIKSLHSATQTRFICHILHHMNNGHVRLCDLHLQNV